MANRICSGWKAVNYEMKHEIRKCRSVLLARDSWEIDRSITLTIEKTPPIMFVYSNISRIYEHK